MKKIHLPANFKRSLATAPIREIRALLVAFSLLSRVPVAGLLNRANSYLLALQKNQRASKQRSGISVGVELRQSVRYFPLVGVFLAIVYSLCYFFYGWIVPSTFSPKNLFILCWGLLAIEVVFSGALHVDGLADFFDGIGSGKNPRECFQIMRDSSIGVYGSLALLLFFSGKLFFLWDNLSRGYLFIIGGSEILSRCFFLLPLYHNPIAQGSKMAYQLLPVVRKDMIINVCLAVLFTLITIMLLQNQELGFSSWAARSSHLLLAVTGLFFWCLFLFGCAYGFSRYCRAKLQGVNGDCLGALQQILLLVSYGLAPHLFANGIFTFDSI